MTDRLDTISGSRILAGTTSLFGLALMALGDDPSPLLILFAIPFLVVLVASIADIPPFTRAVFIWISAAAAVFPAALTIFSGVGFFLAAIILAWLAAAWNESKRA